MEFILFAVEYDAAMKDKPYQKPTESLPPGERQPAPLETKEGGAEPGILTVPECDSSTELAKFADDLLSILA